MTLRPAGQSNDCSLFGSTAPNQFRIDSPKTAESTLMTALDGTPVTFTLTVVANGQKKDKYFNWQATGASVFDVGVKGGMDTARYAYTTPIPNWSGATNGLGAVFSDTGVHATLDNQSKLYNVRAVPAVRDGGSVVVVAGRLGAPGRLADRCGSPRRLRAS